MVGDILTTVQDTMSSAILQALPQSYIEAYAFCPIPGVCQSFPSRGVLGSEHLPELDLELLSTSVTLDTAVKGMCLLSVFTTVASFVGYLDGSGVKKLR